MTDLYAYLAERTDEPDPDRRALSGGWIPSRPAASVEALAIDVAQTVRLTRNYFGPLRVSLWPQQDDEPHPISRFEPAPAHAEAHEYGAVPNHRPPA
ncbi:hypothetical protein EAO70_36430 [Streptomyces sp. adm13(2018)]|uniref:hypothetical protein n=1 Tax=Streptomyces sp. adm13(2018) TaxID=2479007 RepID=UPI0011CD770B|nr:hypothetical protein [Streptomyces sp. adm13(2018)]TXS07009.1 hypothetical protein EAO70_36430 [Streptomyces sp. adm13(2018)]